MNKHHGTADHGDFDLALGSGIAAYESKQFSRAVGLLGPLAEAGDPQAQYRIAIMAQNGLGMRRNPALAYRFMQAAATAGLGLAQHGLGCMYLEGEGTAPDPAQAAAWFRQAADQGLAGAHSILASLYDEGRGVPRDPAEAERRRGLAGFDERGAIQTEVVTQTS